MTTEEMLATVRARRQKLDLNVKLADGRVLSFANEQNRDEFMARARRCGETVEIA